MHKIFLIRLIFFLSLVIFLGQFQLGYAQVVSSFKDFQFISTNNTTRMIRIVDSKFNSLPNCADNPATYSNETRQAILPCVEIPLYLDVTGRPIEMIGLYSVVLEIPFGFSDFEVKTLTFLGIIETSNPLHAHFNPDSGVLDIPRIDILATVPLLEGGSVEGSTFHCSTILQQSVLRAEVLMLETIDCVPPMI